MNETLEKYTIKSFHADFPDDAACLEFVFKTRWPDGGTCKCGKKDCFYPVTGRRSYACSWCGYQISPTAGTIFHKSETSLKSWFFAMFLMSSSKNGVAAKELERQLGVTYKTAHRMGHKIRQLMQSGGDMLCGIVEADETFIGGLAKNMHRAKRKAAIKGTGGATKTPVIGILERGGNVQAKVVSVSGRSKPARKGRMKTSHFEGRIALSAVRTAQRRDEHTQREPATFDFDLGSAWLVAPADCARTGPQPGDGRPVFATGPVKTGHFDPRLGG